MIVAHCASPTILGAKLEQVRIGVERAARANGPRVVARLDISVSRDREAALFEAKVRLGRLLWRRYPKIDYLDSHGLRLPPELERRLRAAGPSRNRTSWRCFGPSRTPFRTTLPDRAGRPCRGGRAQLRRTFAGGVDEIMAYLLVPSGETAESVLALTAEAAQTAAATDEAGGLGTSQRRTS